MRLIRSGGSRGRLRSVSYFMCSSIWSRFPHARTKIVMTTGPGRRRSGVRDTPRREPSCLAADRVDFERRDWNAYRAASNTLA